MSHFGGPKTSKAESIDKTPYTTYYPHNISHTNRIWNQDYYQFVSIDPARKNYALRIERRFHNGKIIALAFDKTSVEDIQQEGTNTVCNTYQVLTEFLDKYKSFYDDSHFIVIERQLPQNYKATRIAQHSITYFSIYLHNKPLLSSIVEIDPRLKGKMLGAPKNITDKQLKSWAIEKARGLLTFREDIFSLKVLDFFKKKQDDLCDTVCQLEALAMSWGLVITKVSFNPALANIIPDKPINATAASNQIIKLIESGPVRSNPPIILNIKSSNSIITPNPNTIQNIDYSTK